jgi:hypothetical protein
LTLSDIDKLNIGDTLDVVIWDGNFEENWIWEHAERDKLYNPIDFFKENRHIATYLGDYQWDIDFPHGETFRHPVHLDVSSLQTNWGWISIEDGGIHITSEVVPINEEIPDGWKAIHKPISEMSNETRVGWRGPMMLWNELENFPQVYLNSHDFQFLSNRT